MKLSSGIQACNTRSAQNLSRVIDILSTLRKFHSIPTMQHTIPIRSLERFAHSKYIPTIQQCNPRSAQSLTRVMDILSTLREFHSIPKIQHKVRTRSLTSYGNSKYTSGIPLDPKNATKGPHNVSREVWTF